VRLRVRAFYCSTIFSNTFEYLQIMSLPASEIIVQPSCNCTEGPTEQSNILIGSSGVEDTVGSK